MFLHDLFRNLHLYKYILMYLNSILAYNTQELQARGAEELYEGLDRKVRPKPKNLSASASSNQPSAAALALLSSHRKSALSSAG
jgi:hypothetical protein